MTVKQMLKDQKVRLDDVFAALAHPIRRAIIERLAEGECTVGELAEPHDVSLPAISQHLRALEEVGLLEQRSEEHTSELQSPDHLVCRLLLEKKKKKNKET